MTSDIKVVVDSSDLQLLSRDLADIPKKAKDSASVFEREFNKVERRLNKTATASQSYYSEILKIDQQSKSAAASAAVFESALKRDEIATKRLATEKERLASKYKPLYAASKQYEIALEEINRAQKLGVLNDQQRSTSISQLNRDFQQGTGIFSTHANMMNKGMNKLGVATQQAGYQVGDFIVQVQSGTNPMVAFSQQMTQMVGVLYLLPPATLNAKIGFMGLKLSMSFLIAGLGIAIPLLGALGAAFLRSKQGAEQTEKPIDDLADAMKTLKDETERAKEQLDLLNSGLKTTAELRVRMLLTTNL
jgi:chromosome segregation ATPase